MSYDLTDLDDRFDYAREVERRGPLQPNEHHLSLLRRSFWTYNDAEFGAASLDPKRPYGNSNVEDDLAELLPDLSPEERLRTHCELPAVLMFMAREWVGGES